MSSKASNIKGLPIFSLSQSKNIGKAEDVVYNPENKKIEAILVNADGLLSEKKAILIGNIKSVGKDAIMVDSDQVLKKETEVPEDIAKLIKSKKTLPKSKVITESGMNLGNISDLIFDSSSGEVQKFEISQGPMKDIQSGKKTLNIDDFISMGDEVAVAKSSTENKVREESEQQGIKGAINKVSTAAQQKTQEIKENPKVQEMTQKISEKTEETKQQQKQNPDQTPPPTQSQPKASLTPKTEETIEDLKEEGIEIRGRNNETR
jgi:uncharacterized protein YrrD